MTQTLLKRIFRFLGASRAVVPDLSAKRTAQQEAELWLSFTGAAGQSSRLMTLDGLLQFSDYQRLYDDLRMAYGDTQDRFQEHALPILKVAFDYIQLLPASRNDHHKMPGGLMYHSMELALFVLQDSQGLQGYRPLHVEIRHPERKQFNYWGRLVLFADALAHDIGKVTWDMVVQFEGLPEGTSVYKAHRGGKRYAVSLVEYAKRHYANLSDARYVWEYLLDYRHRSQHAMDWADITRAILDLSGVPIPEEVREIFLPDSPHFYVPRSGSPSIRDRIGKLDKKSGIASFTAAEEDARSSREEQAIAHMLSCWAHKLALKDMDLIDWFGQSRMFLPYSDIPRILALLPDSPHFDGAKHDPGHPDAFIRGIVTTQKELTGKEMKLVDGQHHVHPNTGDVGVFLSVIRTGNYAAWQHPYLRAAYPQVFSSGGTAAKAGPTSPAASSNNDRENAVDQPSPAPQPTSKANPATVLSKDVSSLGAAIQSPPRIIHSQVEVLKQEAFDLAPELAECHRLAEKLPDGLKTLIFHFESKPSEEFSDDGCFRLDDDRLVVLKPYLRPLIDELEALRFSVDECRAAALVHCANQFVFLDEPTTEIRCTREYTKALLDERSTSGLLFGIDPGSVKRIEPYIKRSRPKKAPTQNRAPDPDAQQVASRRRSELSEQRVNSDSIDIVRPIFEQNPNDERLQAAGPPHRRNDDPITATGFLEHLAMIVQNHRSASGIFVVDKCVQIPESHVDSYVVDKRRRGSLINALTKDEVFSHRDKSKVVWFLTLSNKKVSAWARDLSTQ